MNEIKVSWWQTCSAGNKVYQSKRTCIIPLIEGRQQCRHLTEDKEDPWYNVTVDVTRWSRGWVLTPYHPAQYQMDEDCNHEELICAESHGHSWLVRDDQPDEVWTWLDFADPTPGYLASKYPLTIADGRLVPTGCGPQIDPRFRLGFDDPEEWVGSENITPV
jgi:hypothetical protein